MIVLFKGGMTAKEVMLGSWLSFGNGGNKKVGCKRRSNVCISGVLLSQRRRRCKCKRRRKLRVVKARKEEEWQYLYKMSITKANLSSAETSAICSFWPFPEQYYPTGPIQI